MTEIAACEAEVVRHEDDLLEHVEPCSRVGAFQRVLLGGQ